MSIMEDPKIYVTPEGDFMTEDEDGTVRQATPEEAEQQIQEWEEQQVNNEPEPKPEEKGNFETSDD